MRTASGSNLMRPFYSVTSNKLAWKPSISHISLLHLNLRNI